MLTSTAMAAKTKLFGDESTFQVVTDRVKSICFETHTAQKHEVVKNGLDSKGWLKDCPCYLDFQGEIR